MASANLNGQQVVILPEGSTRMIGRDAQRTNIAVAYAVASAVRTTLGPKGMDKMLVSDLGDIVITNDGATILEEMNIEHPAGKLMVEVAKAQDKEVGDGTTTAAAIAGELLKNAGDLLDQNIHASTIVKGYNAAAGKCAEHLQKIGEKVSLSDKQLLVKIAEVSLGSKSAGVGASKSHIAQLVVDAVTMVAEERADSIDIDIEQIKIEKKEGGKTDDTSLIKGVLIDKEIVHTGMPKEVKGAKVALIDAALEIEKPETDTKIEITSPDQLTAFLKQEEDMLKGMVDKIAASGANVVFCQKGIDDIAQHFLAKRGIVAVRRVKKSDMEKLARATGAKIITSLDDIHKDDLGYAGMVEEKKIGGEAMVFVRDCKNPKSVTIFVRGGSEHVVNEVERAIKDAIGAVSSAVEEGMYVIGGGCAEIMLAEHLRAYAREIGGREQLAVEAFARALEVIPKTLAESAGMDAIDTLVSLRAKQAEKGKYYGVDVHRGKVGDMKALGVIEPLKVKKQAISSAAEAAQMILRIDDVIASKGKPRSSPSSGEGSGMGGGMDM
ncbi:MAG: TCP-1/cpn60 chaperonin family protein [Candidatus Micrarchaeota archaeon]|nr:TCP-1/cpn60 chaperonin family protein [Candidatus Micrarchaeota archaeon]